MNKKTKKLVPLLAFAASASIGFAAPRIITSGTVVTSDDDYVVVDSEGIETAGNVKIEQEGIAIFVTDGNSKITLKPGFEAKPTGSGLFHAIATSDTNVFNQFYQIMIDEDGDGIPSSLEILFGLNPFVPDANGDLDGDGVSNVNEITNGTDPMSDNSWYNQGASTTGIYGVNSIYIVEPNGSGHALNTSNMTLN